MINGYLKCTRACYHSYLLDAQRILGNRGQYAVMPEGDDVQYYRNAMTHSGFAMQGGELCGVFSKWGGQLPAIMGCVEYLCKRDGILLVTLSCFEPVAPIWVRYGFKVEHTVPFEDDLAPPNWPAMLGRPSVVYMSKLMGD